MTAIWVSAVSCVAAVLLQTPQDARDDPFEAFMQAVWRVEAGGRLNPPDGDGGRSIGPLQISRAYWQDSGIGGTWEDVRDFDVAVRCAFGYWSRWCPEALQNRDWETLARVHNGGPRGAQKSATLRYWLRVKEAMDG